MYKGKITESEIEEALNLFNSGLSVTKIAKQLGRDRDTLTKYMKASGANIIQNNNKKYVNSNYFSEINEHSAYWLGLLMADGHVDLNNNSLELTLKDKDHIEKFKQDLSSDHKVNVKHIKNNYYYRLNIRDFKLISDLKKYGFYNNKTYGWNVPNISNEYIKDFIRGLFDGDGCIRLKNTPGSCCCGIVCYSEETLNQIKNIICNNTNIDPCHLSIKKYGNRIPELRIFSIEANEKFLNWIYKDSDIYLNRKYEKYLEFCRLRAISEKK